MTVFFPLYDLSETFSPVVDGRLKSGAGLPMIGSKLVTMHPPRSHTGPPREPGREAAHAALGERTYLWTACIASAFSRLCSTTRQSRLLKNASMYLARARP